jgi:hypothetical protein
MITAIKVHRRTTYAIEHNGRQFEVGRRLKRLSAASTGQ